MGIIYAPPKRVSRLYLRTFSPWLTQLDILGSHTFSEFKKTVLLTPLALVPPRLLL